MAKQFRVQLQPQNAVIEADAGASLFELLRGAGALRHEACGGHTCGLCRVLVTQNGVTQPLLACQTRVDGDMTVRVPDGADTAVLTSGAQSRFEATPREGYAAAFDIGTTTLVCYLLGDDGRQLAVAGAVNPQSAFGADVTARAGYALSHGGEALQSAIVEAMNELLTDCCEEAGVLPEEITNVAIVGNTVMQHLFLGRSPERLVIAPYRPLSREAVTADALSLGLVAAPKATARFLPLIAGHVGADTVGCLLSTDFAGRPGNTLLMDIGTNGELVLGNGARRIACSTAAGPAFEGARLTCGMRGGAGAIDHAALMDGTLSYSVIGGGAPSGVCGSGAVDIAACLLAAGTLDANGRLLFTGALGKRVTTLPDGVRAFVVAKDSETATGAPILLTQRDVRELQLAKAAMAAGVALLADSMGIRIEDIDRVLLAGAFGSQLDAKSACRIGLIPMELCGRVESVGNAAGEGAKLAACSDEAMALADALAENTEVLELAGSPAFAERFVEALGFCIGEARGK